MYCSNSLHSLPDSLAYQNDNLHYLLVRRVHSPPYANDTLQAVGEELSQTLNLNSFPASEPTDTDAANPDSCEVHDEDTAEKAALKGSDTEDEYDHVKMFSKKIEDNLQKFYEVHLSCDQPETPKSGNSPESKSPSQKNTKAEAKRRRRTHSGITCCPGPSYTKFSLSSPRQHPLHSTLKNVGTIQEKRRMLAFLREEIKKCELKISSYRQAARILRAELDEYDSPSADVEGQLDELKDLQ